MIDALSCSDISKTLRGRRILSALNLRVDTGQVVSLIGASGSGKTTLLRVIAGLDFPDSGLILLDGRTVWSKERSIPPERRRIGMVFQDYALWPHMTVAKNLAFGLQSLGLTADGVTKRLGHALDVTRLTAFCDRFPTELSGGQQQRVAIARCLAARPALMLFDEPLSNLDAALRDDMRAEMMELVREEGATVVYVTHDQAEAMAVSDRIAIMRAGSIAQFDSPEAIYEAPSDSFVASFIGGFSLIPGKVVHGLFQIDRSEISPLRTISTLSGESVLVVRPEDARPANSFPGNCLKGIVQSRAFQGRCWRLGVKLGAHKVRLDWPEGPSIGAMLEFSLPPDRCTVLAG